MFRGFKTRLYPTTSQAEVLGQWVGVTRLVYNLALEQRRDFWRQFKATEGKNVGFVSQAREVTDLRRMFDWIAAVPQTILEGAMMDLDKAYQSFFRGGGYPTLRRLGVNDSMRVRARDVSVRDLNARWAEIRLPKLGWVRFRRTRALVGRMLNVTLTRSADGWAISFACDLGEAPALNSLPPVGIDCGVTVSFSLSNGEFIRLPSDARLQKRRRRAQRVLSRRKRGSRRYAAQRQAVQRLIRKSTRSRSHHLHVASYSIARRFGLVGLERLEVTNMTTSAAGTVQEPGRHVRQKAGLNRSILAQGWGIFARQLDYKLEAAGGRLVYVPAAYTSQTCSVCGVVDAQSRKSQAVFACVHCGHEAHADTNAAVEIRRRSTALLGVEEGHLMPSCEALTLAKCSPEPTSCRGC